MLQREVAAPRRDLQGLQLDEGAQRQKEVVGLRQLGARRRTGQRSVLLQGLVVLSHLPPFLVEVHHLVAVECPVARHQTQHALAVVFVRKDLLDQEQREAHLFQIDFLRSAVSECQRLDCLKAPALLVLPGKSHIAVGLQRHHEVLVQLGLKALVG